MNISSCFHHYLYYDMLHHVETMPFVHAGQIRNFVHLCKKQGIFHAMAVLHGVENLNLVNCSVVYDREWKGRGELLGYYYFFKMRPFATAIILHDSVFIQKRIDFSLRGNMQFLWTFNSAWDTELEQYYHELCGPMPKSEEILAFYYLRQFRGCFGLMSVIKWYFLDLLAEDGLFLALEQIKGRMHSTDPTASFVGVVSDGSHLYGKWYGIRLSVLCNQIAI